MHPIASIANENELTGQSNSVTSPKSQEEAPGSHPESTQATSSETGGGKQLSSAGSTERGQLSDEQMMELRHLLFSRCDLEAFKQKLDELEMSNQKTSSELSKQKIKKRRRLKAKKRRAAERKQSAYRASSESQGEELGPHHDESTQATSPQPNVDAQASSVQSNFRDQNSAREMLQQLQLNESDQAAVKDIIITFCLSLRSSDNLNALLSVMKQVKSPDSDKEFKGLLDLLNLKLTLAANRSYRAALLQVMAWQSTSDANGSDIAALLHVTRQSLSSQPNESGGAALSQLVIKICSPEFQGSDLSATMNILCSISSSKFPRSSSDALRHLVNLFGLHEPSQAARPSRGRIKTSKCLLRRRPSMGST